MKQKAKLFVMLMTMLIGHVSAWGEKETITFSSLNYENGTAIGTVEGNNFNITFNKGTNSNNSPKYYTTGTAIRVYGGNYFSVSSSYTITAVELTFGSEDGSNAITTDVGTYSNGTWSGSANSVTFTIGGTTGHRRIASVSVTYTSSSISIPYFTPAAGEVDKGTVVSFNCATGGVTFHYTTNGNDPTASSPSATSYTVNSNVTLKVIAVKNGESSSVATATYTVRKSNPNLAFSETNVTANIGETFTPPTLTYAEGYDGTITYSSSNSAITVNSTTGEVTFDASAVGKTTTITATASETTNFLSGTASYVLTVSDPNAISGNLNNSTFGTSYNGQLPEGFTSLTGHIGDVTVIYSRGSNTDTRAYINDSQIRVYNGYELTFEAPEGYYIKSLVFNTDISSFSCDNGSISGTQWSTSDDVTSVTFTGSKRVDLSTVTITLESAVNAVAKPTITPASGTYTEAQTVTITNNAEGATIYYTTDGTTPTASSTRYTRPFVLAKNGTYTIKAIAISDQGSSFVTTATITINHTVLAPVFTEANGTTFTEPYTIHLTAEEGCTIYYSTNGSPIDEDGNLNSSAIAYPASGIANLSKAVTITAVAVDAGGNVSETATATYKYSGTVAAPYYENFDEGLGNFTTESTGTTPPEWIFRQNTSQADIEKYGEPRKYAFVTGNGNKQGTARLISPVIDLSDETIETASLNFIHAGRYFDGYVDNLSEEQTAAGNAPTHAQLYVREEGGTWEQVTIPNWFTQNSQYTRRNSGEISLDDYVGKKIQVSFLYTADASSTGTWNVLKFAVTTTNAEETEHYEAVNMKTDGYVTYVVQNDIDWVKTLAKNTTADGNNINIHGYKVVEFSSKTAVVVEFGCENTSTTIDKWYSESIIPAETPIILKGTEGDNNLVIAKTDDVIRKPEGNLLKPSYGDVTAAEGQHLLVFQKEPEWTASDPYNHYAFYKLKTGRTIPNRKAYLNGADMIESVTVQSSNPANGIYLLEDLGKDSTLGTDGIADLDGRTVPAIDLNAPIYDLSGRRVNGQLHKGIYIVNGRKVIIK